MIKTFVQYILRILSKTIIKKYKPDVVGITGSIGKTSAKEAIAVVLASNFFVRRSSKNYNNQFGVPLTIIGVDKTPGKSFFGWLKVLIKAIGLLLKRCENYPDILVLEMGADRSGDIQYLTDLAPCKVGVLTFISHAHNEEASAWFMAEIKKVFPDREVISAYLTPVVGAHTGPKGIGVGYIKL